MKRFGDKLKWAGIVIFTDLAEDSFPDMNLSVMNQQVSGVLDGPFTAARTVRDLDDKNLVFAFSAITALMQKQIVDTVEGIVRQHVGKLFAGKEIGRIHTLAFLRPLEVDHEHTHSQQTEYGVLETKRRTAYAGALDGHKVVG